MKKVLITGFDPFGGESINPAFEAVKALPDSIEGYEIIKKEIPTVFEKSYKVLFETIDQVKPEIVICVGQAGGRFEVSPERVAINVDDARIKDNEGNQPIDVKVFEDGENAYFTNLPIKKMVDDMKQGAVPAVVSNTAGTFVCNHIMYALMYYINKNNLNIRGGFIHVPYLPEQVLDKKGQPFMSQELITKGLEISIASAIKNTVDIKAVGGQIS
ncbi:MAG: pyroglutamyl-peptidase I [Fusobacteriaceae bacterium]